MQENKYSDLDAALKSAEKVERQLQQMKNVDNFFKVYDALTKSEDYYHIPSYNKLSHENTQDSGNTDNHRQNPNTCDDTQNHAEILKRNI